jgi:hypothetical protein
LEAQLEVQNAMVAAAQTGVALVDGSAMQSQLLQASGGINQARMGIQQAEENVEQALIGLSQAQMAYDMTAQAYADTAVLFEAGVVARVAYEQAEAAYLNALATLERAESGHSMATIALEQARMGLAQAEEGHRILMEDMPAENLQRARDGLAQAQAARNTILVNIDLAQERLEDAAVTAPIGGVIERRSVEPFGFANPQAPAFVISDHHTMMVSFSVPRSAFEFMAVGEEITLLSANEEFTGEITEISASVGSSGLISVRASIANPPQNLLAGTTVRIFAEAQRAENILILPLGAIHYDRGLPHVYLAEDGFARRVPVEVGIFDDSHIQILYGVSAYDNIISTWSSRLADGAEISTQ